MDEQFRPPIEIPADLKDVLTEDLIPLLPMIFEQAVASLSPEHMARLARVPAGESVAPGLDEVLNGGWEVREQFLQNVWAMLNQPPEYREDSIRSMKALRAYEGTGDKCFLDEATYRLKRIREHTMFETDYEQARITVLMNSGACYIRRYEVAGELSDLELALQILERVVRETSDDDILRPGRLQSRASARTLRYERFGEARDLHAAIPDLREAVAKTHDLSPYLPGYLDSLGNGLRKLYAREGDLLILDEALGAYWQAVKKTPDNHPLLPQLLNNLATAYSDLFDRTKNKDHFDEALRLFERAVALTGAGSRVPVPYLANLGTALKTKFLYTRDSADLDKAVDICRRVVDEASEEPVTRANFLSSLAHMLLIRFEKVSESLIDLEEAMGLLRRSAELIPDTSPYKVFILNKLAYGLALRYDLTGDQDTLEELRATSKITCEMSLDFNAEPEEGLRCARSWGDWEFKWGAWSEAACAYAYVRRISDRLIQLQLFRYGKELWLTEIQGVSGRTAYALAKCGDLSGAVTALEQGRATLLTEALDRDRTDLERLRESASPALYARYASAVDRWSMLMKLTSVPPEARISSPPDAAELVEALRTARIELDAVTEEVRNIPGHALFQLPSSFEEIRNVAADAPLVYLTTTPAGSLALIVTGRGVEVEWFEVTDQELDGLLVKTGPEGGPNGEPHMAPLVGGYVYAQLVESSHLGEALEEILPVLGGKIMAAVANRIRNTGTREVILVPNGQLGSVPLHAASYEVNGQTSCFLDEFDVSYAPNARSLGGARRSLARGPVEPRLAGVGNPLPTTAPSLEWAEFELEGISEMFGSAVRPLYGNAATKAALEPAIRDATYLHLACHGYFNVVSPPDSALLLANDEELTLQELLYKRVKVPAARLAVLSACQSAISAFGGLPDEYIGLLVGLLQAGIPGVVGTLWSVDDHKTALLMVKFYELHLNGDSERKGPMPPAKALCEAQRWLRRINVRELLSFLDDHPAVDRALRKSLRGNSDIVSRAINELPGEPDMPLFADQPALWAPFVFVGV